MLTGNQVRVRFARNRLNPQYIDENDAQWRSVAERLLVLYRAAIGQTRGELEEEVAEAVSDNPTQLVHQGLAKLLEDRCDFDVESGHPPDELRERIFRLATTERVAGTFDRTAIIDGTARELGLSAEQVDRGLFADLKIEQRLIRFQDCTAEQLLQLQCRSRSSDFAAVDRGRDQHRGGNAGSLSAIVPGHQISPAHVRDP